MSLGLIDRFHIWRRKMRWDRQYKKGKWDYLKNDTEAYRYRKIIDYVKTYGTKNPSILDLGAGEGVLNEHFIDFDYSFFEGVDYSKVSIDKANKKQLRNSTFTVADLHHYKPNRHFDIIIFNEAFYYIHDSERARVLNIILDHLNIGGLLITSIYKEGIGCWEYFDIGRLEKLSFEKVDPPKEGTYWMVGAYKKQS
ncbi:class I SAM-dependent methyltransferase [Ichthyenterobacterium sp. W332]|uniref:Class I SAM-dependent methyltransferase n=1 Tax=Microcosmobacter mediterraneus TaxID=3075607 RepID=A0ABU2YQH0_9FLAO|nr:class I SAM-dependent methyltransferase [Ichthyenterobacterium sp. W332]MDT0559510.1 class I SAM-dependent methyltransferase [Ichthyenterobacterium sp. W332]